MTSNQLFTNLFSKTSFFHTVSSTFGNDANDFHTFSNDVTDFSTFNNYVMDSFSFNNDVMWK